MDIVEQIKSAVLPHVLGSLGGQDSTTQENQSNLITHFISLFATKIIGNDAVPQADETTDGASILGQVFGSHEELDSIIGKLAEFNQVDKSQAQSLITTSAPLILTQIKNLAGGESVLSFLKNNVSLFGDKLPSWAISLLPAGVLGAIGGLGAKLTGDSSTTTSTPTPTPTITSTTQPSYTSATSTSTTSTSTTSSSNKSGGGFKGLLPLIGLLLLGLIIFFLWRGCNDNKATAPAENSTTGQVDPVPTDDANKDFSSFNITTGEGNEVYTCGGEVGDQGLKDKILGAVANVFGTSEKCDNIQIDDDNAMTLAGQENLEAALTQIKAVPNASAEFKVGKVIVNAPDATALNNLVSQLQGTLTGVTVEGAQALDVQSTVDQSVQAAMNALNALDANSTPADLANALNLQVINFEVGSDDIPDVNEVVLNKAVEVMKVIPNAALNITGHTDSTGNEKQNVTLSQERADAVKEYLVEQGAPSTALTSTGAGSSQPVADNATDQGKFRNRRISFAAP